MDTDNLKCRNARTPSGRVRRVTWRSELSVFFVLALAILHDNRRSDSWPVKDEHMDLDEVKLNSITECIIGCAYRVHNVLGWGFAERVYVNALAHEIRKAGLSVQREAPIRVYYDGEAVGNYVADIIVDGLVLLETKAVRAFDDAHTAQCLNYLTATGLPLCLLLNFGRKVEVKRLRR